MDPDKHTFSFQVDGAIAEKLNDMVGFCRNNGVKSSDGLVMRALIEQTEMGPDLLGIVRARKEKERVLRRGKFETGQSDAAPTRRSKVRR